MPAKREAGESKVDGAGASLDLLYLFGAGLLVFAYFSTLTGALGDGDTGWHLAAGDWIARNRAIPDADPFSYTFRGAPWTAHEWLSELLMHMAYSAGGWAGLLLLFGAIAAAMFVVLTMYVRRWLAFPAALLPVALCFAGTINHGLARPHIFGWLMLALWMTNLLSTRDEGKVPPLWTAMLISLWANLHGSFVLGIALAAAFGAEAIWEAPRSQRSQTIMRWARFGFASLIAAMLTPHGLEGLVFPLKVSTMTSLPFIGEWKPSYFGEISAFELILLAGIFVCLLKAVRMPVLRLLLLLGLLHLALAHMRHQAVFMIVATFLLARPVSQALEAEGRARPKAPALSGLSIRESLPMFAVMAALVGGVAFASLTYRNVRPDNYRIPQVAIDHIPARLHGRPVFNEYSFGGSLILAGIPVFIDGRADLYGDAFVGDYMKIAKGDVARWEAARRKWKFEWVIMPPDTALVAHLDRQPGWVRLYADKWAVIHVPRSHAQ